MTHPCLRKPWLSRLVGRCALAIVLCFSPAYGQAPSENQSKPVEDTEEYAVYSQLLNVKYYRKELSTFVIAIETTSSKKSTFIGIRTGLAPSGGKRPEVDAETSSDFDLNNRETCLLQRKFDLKIPYILISEEELKSIFPLEKGKPLDMESWHRFYKKYPDSHGILAFSRVGFNAKKNEALVYVANQLNFLGGSGYFFVLSRDGGGPWKVQKEVLLWLS